MTLKTTEIARDAWNGHSRSLKVIRLLYQLTRPIWLPTHTL